MVTCPWCGTNYLTFQSNCSNCGGPLPIPSQDRGSSLEAGLPQGSLSMPPPAPRPIADRYAWRLMTSDGWAITAFVLCLVGGIFTLTGVGLTLGIVTAFVGIPFAVLGILLLGAGVAVGLLRYQEAQKILTVLRIGEPVEGQIAQVEENLSVEVNGRHPWVIHYTFPAGGQTYEGQVSTLNTLGPALQTGQRAIVLYLPQTPRLNVLYPHP